jgi:hypothetical protein
MRKEMKVYAEFEREKEEEVEALYQTFKDAHRRVKREDRISLCGIISGQEFKEFSSNHVTRFYGQGDPDFRTKAVIFSNEPELGHGCSDDPAGQVIDKNSLYAQLLLARKGSYAFGPCHQPNGPRGRISSSEALVASTMRVEVFGDGYMKLSVSSNLIIEDDETDSSSAPAMYAFASHFMTKERDAERVKNASPSPKESWFEMNHPMGS